MNTKIQTTLRKTIPQIRTRQLEIGLLEQTPTPANKATIKVLQDEITHLIYTPIDKWTSVK